MLEIILKGYDMKKYISIMICLLFCISLISVSCNKIFNSKKRNLDEVIQLFQSGSSFGQSPDFIIQKRSVIDPSQWDHTIAVYAFADDGDVAEELVNYLNKTGGKNNEEYRAIQINQ